MQKSLSVKNDIDIVDEKLGIETVHIKHVYGLTWAYCGVEHRTMVYVDVADHSLLKTVTCIECLSRARFEKLFLEMNARIRELQGECV